VIPLEVVRDRVLSYGFATEEDLTAIEQRIKAEVNEAVAFAEASPYPDAKEAYTDNYAQADYPFVED
jgi:pyruvate dehydrogenase E1 component alpha subunit